MSEFAITEILFVIIAIVLVGMFISIGYTTLMGGNNSNITLDHNLTITSVDKIQATIIEYCDYCINQNQIGDCEIIKFRIFGNVNDLTSYLTEKSYKELKLNNDVFNNHDYRMSYDGSSCILSEVE